MKLIRNPYNYGYSSVLCATCGIRKRGMSTKFCRRCNERKKHNQNQHRSKNTS